MLLVAHAVPGGKAESAARRALARGQVVITLDDREDDPLVALGAVALTPSGVGDAWAEHGFGQGRVFRSVAAGIRDRSPAHDNW